MYIDGKNLRRMKRWLFNQIKDEYVQSIFKNKKSFLEFRKKLKENNYYIKEGTYIIHYGFYHVLGDMTDYNVEVYHIENTEEEMSYMIFIDHYYSSENHDELFTLEKIVVNGKTIFSEF